MAAKQSNFVWKEICLSLAASIFDKN